MQNCKLFAEMCHYFFMFPLLVEGKNKTKEEQKMEKERRLKEKEAG